VRTEANRELRSWALPAEGKVTPPSRPPPCRSISTSPALTRKAAERFSRKRWSAFADRYRNSLVPGTVSTTPSWGTLSRLSLSSRVDSAFKK
jgi:hypothetical protein